MILLLCTVLVLSGCSGLPGRTNITSLLSAPKFSQTESDIIKAIDNHIGDNITLRHSTSQGYSAPVQFIDIDGKDEDEAVVFYYAPNKGANIRIAVLSYEDDDWKIVSDKEGLGSEVFFFSAVEFEEMAAKQLLVGYNTGNSDENFFVAYFNDGTEEPAEYTESCQDIIVGDVTYDGYDDVILTNRTADGRIRIRSLTYTGDGEFKTVGLRTLKIYNVEITKLTLARSKDGETVLYADYRDNYNQMHTEGIVFREEGKMFNPFPVTVVSRQWEYSTDLNCVDIDGDGYIETPSVIHEERTEEPAVLKTVEWTDYTLAQPVRKYIGIYDTQEAMFVAVPDSWQNNIYTKYNGDSWQIFRKTEDEGTAEDEDNMLLTVAQVEYRNEIETGAYSYLVYKDAKTWHFSFGKQVELSEIQHMLKSVTDLE